MEIRNIEAFLKYYARIKDRTRTLFEYIPREHVEWTYLEGKFTIGDLLRHLALTERQMYAENVQGNPGQYQGCDVSYAKGLENIITLYNDLHDESVAIFSSLTPDRLNQKCITPGGYQVTVWKLLRAMVEHEVHHRGQLYTYLGMLQVKTPPIFGLTSEEVIEKGKNQ